MHNPYLTTRIERVHKRDVPFASEKHRKLAKSNVRYADRDERWEKLKSVLHAIRSRFGKAHPIPVNLRPWVPHVAETLAAGGPEAEQIAKALHKLCTRGQWQALQTSYPDLKQER